jgi:class 3 adenylate cyclase
MVRRADVDKVVHAHLHKANLAVRHLREKFAARFDGMLGDVPEYAKLSLGHAVDTWAVILFVDVRGSTKRAKSIGAVKTYLTMHAFVPAMAFLVQQFKGFIVGFRGDGLFAAFGLGDDGSPGTTEDDPIALKSALRCGQAMLEAVDCCINPALEAYEVPTGLKAGVGIDSGGIIITKIGYGRAFEVTAYGDCVNGASKLADRDQQKIHVSKRFHDSYPESTGGKVGFSLDTRDGVTSYVVKYPFGVLSQPPQETRMIDGFR